MENLEVIVWAIGGGFALMFGVILAMWNNMNKQYSDLVNRFETRMDRFETRMDRFETRMDKFEEKLTDIDRRLCRLEGAFSAKDCCALNESHRYKQAEGQ